MDETWITVDERKTKVIVPREYKEASTIANNEKVMHITLVMCLCADGFPIPTTAILPLKHFPKDLQHQHDLFCWSGSESGWINEEIFEKWVEQVFVPVLNIKRLVYGKPNEPALLWLDGHSTRSSVKASAALAAANVVCVTIPAHTSHILQPLDCGVFRTFKSKLSSTFERPLDDSTPAMRVSLLKAAARAAHAAVDSRRRAENFISPLVLLDLTAFRISLCRFVICSHSFMPFLLRI